ncbi:MAG: methyltransferase domain-containing protein [Myxococcaceae bacterium]
MSARRDKLLRHIDLAKHKGLEIGALDKPLITPDAGDVRYVDYATTEQLRQNHANTPSVDTSKIVPVHYVWGEKSLAEAVGAERFDFVVASHVIEHVPDIVTWLHELAEILKPGGVVSLIVPDKRFIFDRLRRTTGLSELMEAHLSRRRKPSLGQVFDYYARHARVDAGKAWAGLDDAEVERVHDEAFALEICRGAVASGRYVDAHCWVFTPYSFVELLRALAELELLPFRVAGFSTTAPGEIDFFVTLSRLSDGLTPAERRRLGRESLPALADEPPPPGRAAPGAPQRALEQAVKSMLKAYVPARLQVWRRQR